TRPYMGVAIFGRGLFAGSIAFRTISAGRRLRYCFHNEWRLHVRLDLLELREHLPVLGRGSELPVDEVLGSLIVYIPDFPQIVLFVETSFDFLELQFFLQFL